MKLSLVMFSVQIVKLFESFLFFYVAKNVLYMLSYRLILLAVFERSSDPSHLHFAHSSRLVSQSLTIIKQFLLYYY